jgi:hypothetical protein
MTKSARKIKALLIVSAFLLWPAQAGDLGLCQTACKSYAHQVYNACITAGNTSQHCNTLLEKTYHDCVSTACR